MITKLLYKSIQLSLITANINVIGLEHPLAYWY